MLEAVTTDGQKITVYVGDAVKGQELRLAGHKIHFIFADGDELAHIQETFDGLPSTKKSRLAFYYGDYSKFIAGNWTWS